MMQMKKLEWRVGRREEIVSLHKQKLEVVPDVTFIYTNKEELMKSVELKSGDVIILLNGGHGYEILEDGTKVLEVKNGPYVGGGVG